MTYKQIETSREARLWISQVIIPVVATAGIVLANPEARKAVSNAVDKVKTSIKKKFKRE